MKKQTKSSKAKSKKVVAAPAKQIIVVHNGRQRLFGIIALLGLFACGFMVGLTISAKSPNFIHKKQIAMDETQCVSIANRIVMASYGRDCDDCNELIRELNDVYEKNCAGRMIVAKEPAQKTQEDNAEHEAMFRAKPTCEQIEILLSDHLTDSSDTYSGNHITNAKIYANLSERGCPENSEKYKKMAEQELQIARALEDDYLNDYETMQVVETYKRIKMKQQAQEVLDKVKKLTNPAIDFIIEVEKIINE